MVSWTGAGAGIARRVPPSRRLGPRIRGHKGGCVPCGDVGAAFEEEGVTLGPPGQHGKYAGSLGERS